MSTETLTLTDNPLDPTLLDEETELRALARSLQFAEGFKLIFVRCNQPQHRQRLIETLRAKQPGLNIRQLTLDKPITHLLDFLRASPAEPQADAVFISGIEYSLPVAAEAHATPFVANLNAARNSFPRVVSSPLVLWVPEYVLSAFMLGAPDFFSVRSGVYYFAATPGETVETANALTAGTTFATDNLSLAEKQERVEAIRSLLEDYEALPNGQRDLNTEKRLHSRLDTLLFGLGMYDSAKLHNERVLDIARQTDDKFGEGAALNNFGMIFYQYGQWDEAIVMYEQALQIAKRFEYLEGEMKSLGNLANVYCQQQRWEEAKRICEQCIEICRTLEDRAGEGWQFGNLALVLDQKGEFAAAEEAYRRSVEISRGIGDQSNETRVLINLGAMYAKQGRLSEAENSYRQSLETACRIGMRDDEWRALFNLALLHNTQGNLKGAIELQRQAVEVLKKMDDVRNLTHAQEVLTVLEQQLASEQQTDSETTAPQPPKR
jgi:tetratricopeptide (TPR) repeat protein